MHNRMMVSKEQKVFLALVRAGLWEEDVQLGSYGEIDFKKVHQLAEEQSVVGLVAAGIEHVTDTRIPKDVVLSFVGQALQLEQRNKAMNRFVCKLMEMMENGGIYTLLVKGQGIAQCYERPLWRTSGDIDLLLSPDDYNKAKELLCPMASFIARETKSVKHLGLTIDSWIVELHGTLCSGILSPMDKIINSVQTDTFSNHNVRIWDNDGVKVLLPNADNDVIFVFTHIIKHFLHEGIGLRQILDWCRLLWIYKDSLNQELLKSRIEKAGLMTEWMAFAALAVNYLGMPAEAMPLYDSDAYWSRKGYKILSCVFVQGNFGHNVDKSYRKSSFVVRKAISTWRYTTDALTHFFIFPLNSFRVWINVMKVGMRGGID